MSTLPPSVRLAEVAHIAVPARFARSILTAISTLMIATLLVSGLPTTAAEASDPARKFMQRAANALIAAQRQGTPAAFARTIRRYGHVPAIGMDALGSYRTSLKPNKRRSYYRGLVKFIGRYAAKEGRKYAVARVSFPTPAIRDGRHVMVDSVVHLRDGSRYDVRWMLVPRGKSFKVRDAQVLGFWVSPFLTRLFENYISENGGRVEALVLALNR